MKASTGFWPIVRRGKLDVIVCFKLDRLGRSLAHLAQIVGELTSHRVALVCPSQGIDTSGLNPASQLQLNILMPSRSLNGRFGSW